MTANTDQIAILGYCRAGFEPELVAEFNAHAGKPAIRVVSVAGSGFVHALYPAGARGALQRTAVRDLVFARQILIADSDAIVLPERDRVTPIVERARAFLQEQKLKAVADVWIEYPDTNDGKSLSKLAGALQSRILEALAQAGLIAESADRRLHVLLTPDRKAWCALADVQRASTWPLGIPRLRMPRDAPSRSTLKLAEAMYTFLGDREEKVMMPEMRAVDLGAAPGGWTWQLIHRGLHVTAVDNAELKGELVDNALVRHIREDGFRFQPKKNVDWMVCDMVESPSRIAHLVARWLSSGWARHVIFNLKLPMKKRYEEVLRCRAIIEDGLQADGRIIDLRIRQMYHDREEVTGYCTLVSRRR
ncbi:MAG: 23S rRNA (cytidine(2498)-2'-O)-methyltransferase RlmM [Betaproteobacteria bacterium]|nr:23S rRNA (cytidine(2498)-2'-O)-methyltransferase RlmM [Betaproteobacteria bacterium]